MLPLSEYVTSFVLLFPPLNTLLQIGVGVLTWVLEQALRHPLLFAVTALLIGSYFFLSRPTLYIKDLSDVGFNHLTEGLSKKHAARVIREDVEERVEPKDLPPVYPNGWIPLLNSHLLAKGQVKAIKAFGEQLAVFRGESGKVFVTNAYCPHLGANIAVGGKVQGDCIRCPFHGWTFDGSSGECVQIPYSEKVPAYSNLPTWHSCEVINLIFVWYHAEGEPPSWEVPPVPEIEDGTMWYKGRSQHTVHCHMQEMMENGADVSHFNALHGDNLLAGNNPWTFGSFWRRVMTQSWTSTWQLGPEPHQVTFNIWQDVFILGIKIPFMTFTVQVLQCGPALVIMRLNYSIGKSMYIQYTTPEGPLRHKVGHVFYGGYAYPNWLARIFLLGEAAQVERDITMWNNKIFRRKPLLVGEDKTISKFRRWFSQFYSENSPTLKSIRQKSLDW